jgi:hypothetical protein
VSEFSGDARCTKVLVLLLLAPPSFFPSSLLPLSLPLLFPLFFSNFLLLAFPPSGADVAEVVANDAVALSRLLSLTDGQTLLGSCSDVEAIAVIGMAEDEVDWTMLCLLLPSSYLWEKALYVKNTKHFMLKHRYYLGFLQTFSGCGGFPRGMPRRLVGRGCGGGSVGS